MKGIKKYYITVVAIFLMNSYVFGQSNGIAMFHIDSSGNVGIGTTSPNKRLHIESDDYGQVLLRTTNSTKYAGIKMESPDAGKIFTIGMNGASGPYPNKVIFDLYGGGDGFLFAGGNVGIGTLNPIGMLDVNGSIYHRGSELYADYVFDKDYEIESIEEHASFMWTEKHLPAIPRSTKDKNGLEVLEIGAHRKGIVEELEKAHVYIEQLHKEIEQLKTAMSTLQMKMEAELVTK